MPALARVRGASIVLVSAFHVELPVVSGGPVRVTVFFVLRGSLITTLLIAEWSRTGGVDLRSFYRGRVRRLLPTLVVAVGVVFVIEAGAGHSMSVTSESPLALTYAVNSARRGRSHGDMEPHLVARHRGAVLPIWPITFLAFGRRVHPARGLFIE